MTEAIDAFRAAGNLQPGDVPSRKALAELLAEQGRFAEVIDIYREIVRLGPSSPDAYYALAAALARADRHDDAVDAFREGLRRHPEDLEFVPTEDDRTAMCWSDVTVRAWREAVTAERRLEKRPD